MITKKNGQLNELSPRQREIAKLLAKGMGDKAIAAKLGVSASTVRHHNEMIFLKLGAENRTQAALMVAGVL